MQDFLELSIQKAESHTYYAAVVFQSVRPQAISHYVYMM